MGFFGKTCKPLLDSDPPVKNHCFRPLFIYLLCNNLMLKPNTNHIQKSKKDQVKFLKGPVPEFLN